MADLGQGLYGFYQGLKPNQRQGDEVAEKHVERMNKSRALDIAEERNKPKAVKRDKIEYAGEQWEVAPKNWSNITATLQQDFETMAAEIQANDELTDVEKKVAMTRIETNPDALIALWKDAETFTAKLNDPEFIDSLDEVTIAKMRDDIDALLSGKFDVSLDKDNDNKIKITYQDGSGDFSIGDVGVQLDAYKSDLSMSQGKYAKKKRFAEESNFRGDAQAQWANHRRKKDTDADVISSYKTSFETIYGEIVPDDKSEANPYNPTQSEFEKVMKEQYTQDFNKADPLPYPTVPTDKTDKEKSIWDYRVANTDLISFDSGNGGKYAPKAADGSKAQNLRVNYMDPEYGTSVPTIPLHIVYNESGDASGVVVQVEPNSEMVKAYLADEYGLNAQQAENASPEQKQNAITYLTSSSKFIPSNEAGLIHYLKNNIEEAFPEDIAQAQGLKTDKEFLDLYFSKYANKDIVRRSYNNNRASTNSQFKYTLEALKETKNGGGVNYAAK